MVRVVAILAGIFLAAYVAVHLGYAKLEKELLGRSCCGIAELPVPESGNQGEGKKTSQPTLASPTNSSASDSQASNTPGDKNPQEETSSRAADTGSPEQPVNNENPDFQVIIRRDIFQLIPEEQSINTDQRPAAVQKTAPKEVPTRLNLTLLGTVLGDDETSRAI
ncbi:MAG: hypothetical protein D3922_12210, partial [Candidatus Electrothrix sp. AR1]|nr:hypothetical protein [Candidatus Electrothrix sp. AR1]